MEPEPLPYQNILESGVPAKSTPANETPVKPKPPANKPTEIPITRLKKIPEKIKKAPEPTHITPQENHQESKKEIPKQSHKKERRYAKGKAGQERGEIPIVEEKNSTHHKDIDIDPTQLSAKSQTKPVSSKMLQKSKTKEIKKNKKKFPRQKTSSNRQLKQNR